MYKSIIFLLFYALVFAGEFVCAEPAPGAGKADELQVLIDVSGSMKQNDPHNLRIEASRLLINLLPDASKVALWLFAEKTAPLIATDTVNAAWKQQAIKASSSIHSRGLRTNIEDAIQTVLAKGFSGSGSKHLILLTDGFVDTSKDIMQSADSRERILSELIPKLQQQNIQVQTVALSDEADKELLEKLAFDTGGWAETAQTAERLQKVFLKMAQKAAPKDTLPLTDNKFGVDGGIQEFSVLVFKKPHAAATQLVAPDGKKLSKQSMTANLSWLESPGYDLITVKQPATGNWGLLAEVDPDNQVMIVTDLKLQLEQIPNFIGEHDSFSVKAHFTDKDNLITRADFLGMLSLDVVVDQQAPVKMAAVNVQPGFYEHGVSELSLGKHVLKVLADGKTFKREIVHEIEVVATPISVEKQVNAEQRQVSLKLVPDLKALNPTGMLIDAVISQDGQAPQTLPMNGKDGVWTLDLPGPPPAGVTRVNFNVMAKDHDGKPVSPPIKPLTIDDSWFAAPAVVAPTEAEPVAKPEEHEAEPHADEHTEAAHEPSQPTDDAPINWLLVGGILFAVNLLLAGGGFFIYRYLKKSQADKHQQLLERLS